MPGGKHLLIQIPWNGTLANFNQKISFSRRLLMPIGIVKIQGHQKPSFRQNNFGPNIRPIKRRKINLSMIIPFRFNPITNFRTKKHVLFLRNSRPMTPSSQTILRITVISHRSSYRNEDTRIIHYIAGGIDSAQIGIGLSIPFTPIPKRRPILPLIDATL